MPMLIHIYKNDAGDCSNGGLSSRCNEALAFGHDEVFDMAAVITARKRRYVEAVRITRGNVPGVAVARPIDILDGTALRGMFGGCFVYSSDARFRDMVERAGGPKYAYTYAGAIALHDRFE